MVIAAIRMRSLASRKQLCSIMIRKSEKDLIEELEKREDLTNIEYLILPEEFDLSLSGELKHKSTYIKHAKVDDPRLQNALSSGSWKDLDVVN